ncbi:stalk domain-containing protein [Psychrobacillus psychrodurans]|uniref:stalk domain-containing protein n=1 Tax=Psychrobacillus psychrodurans TaxID=126157 RepID=UPI0008EB0EA9|nr:stalk domain-containing protein [Psychrobacillus psychrodurans]MCZ8541273.1 copper amine oxidase N-terminal domain-containing protein [Psychrobacillus psychrodurans]SFM89591.1 Copper amine oxidase N-terminal domain-containing protein [Psychrobacillus psychrodurans]
MKKIFGVFAMILMLGLGWSQGSVYAKSDDAKIEATNFVKGSGIITNVEEKKDTVTLTVETTGKEPQITFYTVTSETMIYISGSTKKMEKVGFQKGQQIDAYYGKDKPMIMIYPPQISPELIVVHDAKTFGSVKVGKFDEELRSLDNKLNLKVDGKTTFENTEGEKIERQDLSGKELIVFYTVATKSIPAQTAPTKVVAISPEKAEEAVEASNFVKFSGVITDITNDKNQVALTVVTEEDEPTTTIFTLDNNVLLLNGTNAEAVKKESFQVGQKIDAYYDKNKPMILIYPARITPEILIVQDKEKVSFSKVSKFDQDMISLDGELKLNISTETEILNENGEVITKKDLEGKELIVFYNITTKSIPAQTVPTKIVAVNYLSADLKQIINNDHFIQNGVKMIPLLQVAEQLGYKVESYPASSQKTVTLTKGNSSIKVIRNMNIYSYNKSLRLFLERPVLKDKKTYVSEEILDILK